MSERRDRLKKIAKIALPILFVAIGVTVLVLLVATRPELEKAEPEETATVVEVVDVSAEDLPAVVRAHGQVSAARRAQIATEVSGRVSWVAKELVPGGHFRRGERLLQLDETDFRLAVESRKSELSRAKVDVMREENRRLVSERALEIYAARMDAGPGQPEPLVSPLTRNIPQLAAAEQAVEAARAMLERAEADLRRTTLVAPFDATVESETVGVGQVVGPNQPVATLVESDRYWVRTSVEVGDLAFLDVPGVRGAREGSRARITYTAASRRTTERIGRVLRVESDLDPQGSMARVVIEVRDPLGLSPDTVGPPLLLGAFVDVAIEGEVLERVIPVPRTAVHEDDEVWVVGKGDRLVFRRVEIARRREHSVLVRSGLEPGDRVVTSKIALPVPGMLLDPRDAREEVER